MVHYHIVSVFDVISRMKGNFRQCHLPLSRARVFYQLITSNTGYQSLFWGGVSHRFMLENRCPLCDLEQDSLEHFLVGCIRLTRCRALAGIDTSPLTTTATERMAKILTVQDEAEMTSVWNFLVDGLEMRRFMVAMLEWLIPGGGGPDYVWRCFGRMGYCLIWNS